MTVADALKHPWLVGAAPSDKRIPSGKHEQISKKLKDKLVRMNNYFLNLIVFIHTSS